MRPAPFVEEPIPRPAAEVTIERVGTSTPLADFIALPSRLYADFPAYVPPLLMERRAFLDRKKNPWFEHGEAELLVARRNGRLVGRVAAVDDRAFNDFHKTNEGHFGLFDCEDDAGTAAALLRAVRQWLATRGRSTLAGPYSYSTNDECGLLVDGFDAPPTIRTAWNPPWAPKLLEHNGLRKAKDLWAYELSPRQPIPEKVTRVAAAVAARHSLRLRPVRLRDFDAEIRRLREIYNSAWERNWGFVPMTDREFSHLAAELRPAVVPGLLLIAERGDEPVAFSLAIPDANIAIKAARGRLTTWGLPLGLARMWWASRGIKRLRLITLGVKASHRRMGVDALLYVESIRAARALGFTTAELSWVLEDNDLMNRAIRTLGGKRSRTWRIYEGSIP